MGTQDLFNDNSITHEEKVKLAYKQYRAEMVNTVFPKGEVQADIIVTSLAIILNVELAGLSASEYFNIMTIYSNIVVRKILTNTEDDVIVAYLAINYSHLLKDDDIAARRVLAFCSLNLNHNDFNIATKEDINILDAYLDVLKENEKIVEENASLQNVHIHDDYFGLVPEKPVYTKGIEGAYKYLNSLCTYNDEKIKWTREGSLSVSGIKGMVDIYDIFLESGQLYKRLYINIYGTEIPSKSPEGFQIKYKGAFDGMDFSKNGTGGSSLSVKNRVPLFDKIKLFIWVGLIAVFIIVLVLYSLSQIQSILPSENRDISYSELHETIETNDDTTAYTSNVSHSTYIITFDKQGGLNGTDSTTIIEGDPLPGALPPERAEYIFEGYYDEPEGLGTKYYDENMRPVCNWYRDSNIILYAYWVKINDSNVNRFNLTKDNFETYFELKTEAEIVDNEITITYSIEPKSDLYAKNINSSEFIYVEIGALASSISAYFGDPSYDKRQSVLLYKAENYIASGSITFEYFSITETIYWMANAAYCFGNIYE